MCSNFWRHFGGRVLVFSLLACGFLQWASPSTAFAQSIMYQGELRGAGAPVEEPSDFRFRLYDASSGGVLIDGPITLLDVPVVGGRFAVELAFAPGSFDGSDVWLEIDVRSPAGVGDYVLLSPRQAVTPAPSSIHAHTVGAVPDNALSGAYSNELQLFNGNNLLAGDGAAITGLDASNIVTGSLGSQRLSGTYSLALNLSNAANVFTGSFSGSGAGLTSLDATNVSTGILADARLSANIPRLSASNSFNAVNVFNADVGIGTNQPVQPLHVAGNARIDGWIGTDVNQPVEFYVNNQRALRLEYATAFGFEVPNIIAGHASNNVMSGVMGAVIGGGGDDARPNVVTDINGTVGGGLNNLAGNDDGTINNRQGATVGGGYNNSASGLVSTVGGGYGNIADGEYATVPGGRFNEALGNHSFAAGDQARAGHDHTFVWQGASGASFSSTAAEQFLINAPGGVGIGTNAPASTLHLREPLAVGEVAISMRVGSSWTAKIYQTPESFFHFRNGGGDRMSIGPGGNVGIGTNSPQFLLHVDGSAGKPGGGSWSNSSDRRLKKNIDNLDGALDSLLALRGVTFEYIDPEAIHELPGPRIGVIAQEVEEVFPDWVDTSGFGYKTVTFRGFEALTIEALRDLRDQKDIQIRELRRENAALRAATDAEIAELRDRIESLERVVDTLLERQ